jgi:4'-phosphopantetheinyl transferase
VSLVVTPFEGAERVVGEGKDGGTVDLWSASLEPPAPLRAHLEGCLSLDERERAARFVFPRDRNRFVAGRAFLRLLLAQYLATDPASLRFRYGPHGKPALADDRSGVAFNLAHSNSLAVCALARGGELGVDVERVRPIPDADGVARSFFSPRESAELASVPEPERHRAFFDGWTRKEAFLKALGDGLARPLDSFDVTLKPGDPPRLLRTVGDPEEAGRFSLHSLEPEAGYVAAIAVRGHGWHVRLARWRWIESRRAEGGEATSR